MDMVFQQANESLKSFTLTERESLISNLVENLMFVDDTVQKKVVHCLKLVNEELGIMVEKQL